MKVRTVLRALVVTTILAVLATMLPQMAAAAPEKASGRYLLKAWPRTAGPSAWPGTRSSRWPSRSRPAPPT
jgi:hypothetical protein